MINQTEFLGRATNRHPLGELEIGCVSFHGVFNNVLIVEGAIFKDKVDFSKSIFNHTIVFKACEFFGPVSFESVVFMSHVFFEESIFHDEANFIKTSFSEKVNFSKVKFNHKASFTSASFTKFVDFKYSEFNLDVFFIEAKFLNQAFFYEATFNGHCSFERAEFAEDAEFTHATFFLDVNFVSAIFNMRSCFNTTNFHNTVYFTATQFIGDVFFGNSYFHKIAIFTNAQFNASVLFTGNPDNQLFSEVEPTIMESVKFHKPEAAIFKCVNLSKCHLINTNISSIELLDITWPKVRNRKVVYDEISNNPKINYALIEVVYRQLKKYYEDRGGYNEGGDFHYGEMEMRRRSLPHVYKYLSLTAIYKYLSGYGENYQRSIINLFLIIFIFSIGNLLTGIESKDQHTKIFYNLSFNISVLWDFIFWSDFLSSIFHTFEVSTFQKDQLFKQSTMGGRFIDIIQSLIISFQVALIILAIKRKFRR